MASSTTTTLGPTPISKPAEFSRYLSASFEEHRVREPLHARLQGRTMPPSCGSDRRVGRPRRASPFQSATIFIEDLSVAPLEEQVPMEPGNFSEYAPRPTRRRPRLQGRHVEDVVSPRRHVEVEAS